jgi:hypothetical protein
MIKSRRMRRAGSVARMGEKTNAYFWESQKEINHYENLRRKWWNNNKIDLREVE